MFGIPAGKPEEKLQSAKELQCASNLCNTIKAKTNLKKTYPLLPPWRILYSFDS